MTTVYTLRIDGRDVGRIGMLAPAVLHHAGLERPIAAFELALAPLLAQFPPETRAAAMPAFPAIDRDVSAIVAEDATWASLVERLESLRLDHLEAIEHVVTYRGRQIGDGRKSVSMRLVFRHGERTLRSEEVDASIERAIAALRADFKAEIRS
jgi:phenylalanyl-tRNA synthetase beta chain